MLREISFYNQYQEDFRIHYQGRYMLIKGERIMGDFCTWQEASFKGLELCGQDAFLVKYCA